MDIENYPDIFKSFYQALNSTECKPVFIKLDHFYPSVVHLTNEIEPEIVSIKFKTINLKIFCTADPMIKDNIVKYWTMYIDDDLDIARRKKKRDDADEEDRKISLNLRPNAKFQEDEEFVYEKEETMGIYDDDTPSNNQKIIEEGFKDADSVPVYLEKGRDNPLRIKERNQLRPQNIPKTVRNPPQYKQRPDGRVARDLREVGELENNPRPAEPKTNQTDPNMVESDESIIAKNMKTTTIAKPNAKAVKVSNTTEAPNSTSSTPVLSTLESVAESVKEGAVNITKPVFVNETAEVEKLDKEMRIRNETEEIEKQNQNQTIQDAIQLLNETDKEMKIPDAPPYTPEMEARIEDEKHVGGKSIKEMGEQTETKSDLKKDEDESARQMGVVIYTFSDKVTPGLLQYSVITFYVSVVFVAGKLLRGYLWGDTSKIYLSELPYPDELLVI